MSTSQHTTIDAYIRTFPKDVQSVLKKLRQVIAVAAPGAVEAIKYQMPAFVLNGKSLVYFAAWKKHIGFYPTPSATTAFSRELTKYEGAKGSIKFSLDTPLPFTLITKIVQFRVREVEKRAKKK